jgi:hypothetical protein
MRTGIRILGIILIFLFGVFIGMAVTGAGIVKKAREVMLGGREAMMNVVVKRLNSELKLDPEQKRKVQTIVDDALIKLRQNQAKIQPEIDATVRDAEQRVREVLYPNQVEKFDRLVNRSREKWKPKEQEQETPKEAPKEDPKETPKPPDNAAAPHTGD